MSAAGLSDREIRAGWEAAVAAIQAGQSSEKLIRAIEKLMALDPDFAGGHMLLGTAYAQLHRFDRAGYHLAMEAAIGQYRQEARAQLAALQAEAEPRS